MEDPSINVGRVLVGSCASCGAFPRVLLRDGLCRACRRGSSSSWRDMEAEAEAGVAP